MSLQIRRGTEAERLVLASPPQSGELIWITDDQKMYIGDGVTLAKDLVPVTGFNAEDAADTIGAILQTDSTHLGISFAYNDAAGTINATVSLDSLRQNVDMNGQDITGNGNINIGGTITATKFVGDYQGSISADDSTIMVDAVNGKFNLNGTINTDVIPDANEAYDIGSAAARFKDLYLSGSSINLGGASITTNTAGGVNLPAGSTIDGGPIGGAGAGQSLNVDIVGDDSTILVNSSNNVHQGVFIGDVTGSVYADDSTALVNAVDGTVTLDNGNVRIENNAVLSTAASGDGFEFDISTWTEAPFNTTLNVYNTNETSAIRINTVNGGANDEISGIAIRGHYGGYPGSGTETKPTAGDYIGEFVGTSYDPTFGGGTQVFSSGMFFRTDPNEAIADDTAKGQIEFVTNSGTGTAIAPKYLVFDSAGQLAINQTSASATLDVNGFAKLAVLTAAPASPANGMIAIADGATWDPAGTGTQAAVAYLGGGWVTLGSA